MADWVWLCASLALNGWLLIHIGRCNEATRKARIEAGAEKLVAKLLAEEAARKLGPRKVVKLIHAAEIKIKQMGQPRESEA
jgi:hypothetical protein